MAGRAGLSLNLPPVGIWTRQLDSVPAAQAEVAANELEMLGFTVLWIPEAIEREVLTHATLLLGATSKLVVATGIARVHSRTAQATALAQLLLAERFPDRFVLGLGVSHPLVVERMLGLSYGSPLRTMGAYLDAMDAVLAVPHPAPPSSTPPRVLAALGPKMLALAAQRADGAHTYLAPVAHTAYARDVLGPDVFLAPAIKVVLDDNAERARAVARASVRPTSKSPAYRRNLERFGFGDDDLNGELSDSLVDALVAHGDVDAVADRVREHLAAGADHVCVEVLTGDDTTMPLDAWRALAPSLLTIAPARPRGAP